MKTLLIAILLSLSLTAFAIPIPEVQLNFDDKGEYVFFLWQSDGSEYTYTFEVQINGEWIPIYKWKNLPSGAWMWTSGFTGSPQVIGRVKVKLL